MTRIDLSEPIEFIDSKEFHQADAEALCLAPDPPRPPLKPVWPGASPYELMCRHHPLSRFEEIHYARKMNYLKFMAEQVRTSDQPDAHLIHELLIEASMIRGLFVLANMGLIGSAIRLLRLNDELISDYTMCLFRCADKFNYSFGNKFSTLATFSLRRWRYKKHRQRRIATLSVATEDNRELVAEAVDYRFDEPDRSVICQENERIVSRALRALPERWREIVQRRHGFHDGEVKSCKAIGGCLGVTGTRIRDIEKRAYKKLQQRLSGFVAAEMR